MQLFILLWRINVSWASLISYISQNAHFPSSKYNYNIKHSHYKVKPVTDLEHFIVLSSVVLSVHNFKLELN